MLFVVIYLKVFQPSLQPRRFVRGCVSKLKSSIGVPLVSPRKPLLAFFRVFAIVTGVTEALEVVKVPGELRRGVYMGYVVYLCSGCQAAIAATLLALVAIPAEGLLP